MKRIVSLILFVSAILSSVWATASENATVGDAAMKAVGIVEQLAAKIGTMAPAIWDALLLSQRIDGISGLFAFVVMMILLVFIGRYLLRHRKNDDYDEVSLLVTLLVIWIVLAICVFTMFFFLSDFILAIVKPEVGVIKTILKAAIAK
jgi:heme/copper-type cytochrome/quinol oxidase subunit 2